MKHDANRSSVAIPAESGAKRNEIDHNIVLKRYPLLTALLAQKGLHLKGTYTNRDVAKIFEVSIRAIQDRTSTGELRARDLPGRGRFLSDDLEEFLRNSTKNEANRQLRTDRYPPSRITLGSLSCRKAHATGIYQSETAKIFLIRGLSYQ